MTAPALPSETGKRAKPTRRFPFGPSLIKRILPRTLFGRSILIIVTPVLLVQVIATFVFYDRHWSTMTDRLSNAVAGEIALIIDYLDRAAPQDEDAFSDMVSTTARTVDLLIAFQDGASLEEEPKLPWNPNLRSSLNRALEGKLQRQFQVNPNIAESWVEIRVQLDDGVLRVIAPDKRLFSSTTYIFILWMVGSSVGLFAIAIIFMRNQIRPIRRLAVAADSFGKNRDVPNFKPEGATEVRQAAAAFIRMRDRIQRQIAQRTEMLAGVSHDLRTPLTRMKLQLAMLDENDEVRDLRADVTEMETMIEGYLAFARGEGASAPEATDLGALIREIVANVPAGQTRADVHVEEDLIVPVRQQDFRRCLGNLILNAARYGRHVWVQIGRRDTVAEIVIDDDGPGIPEEQRRDVFRPFYRMDESRNSDTGGIGLGLTIARDIARGHGGDIALGDSPRGGLRVTVRLPL